MKWLIANTLIITFFLLSCENNGAYQKAPESEQVATMNNQEPGGGEKVATDSAVFADQKVDIPPDPTVVKSEWDKKIVKSGTLNMEIKDFKVFSRQLAERVKTYGGYIGSEEQNSSPYKIESSVVIRVPVDKFDAALNDLAKDADKLTDKKITAEDQTREYIDSRSRLEAKKQVRLKYLDLLKQAKNMSEIIEVQQEINSIQEEIEIVSGRINQISATAAMSTIHLTYYQILNSSAMPDNDEGFFTRLLHAFAKGWHWIGELLIGLSTIWPLLLLIGVGGYFFRKKLLTTPKTTA